MPAARTRVREDHHPAGQETAGPAQPAAVVGVQPGRRQPPTELRDAARAAHGRDERDQDDQRRREPGVRHGDDQPAYRRTSRGHVARTEGDHPRRPDNPAGQPAGLNTASVQARAFLAAGRAHPIWHAHNAQSGVADDRGGWPDAFASKTLPLPYGVTSGSPPEMPGASPTQGEGHACSGADVPAYDGNATTACRSPPHRVAVLGPGRYLSHWVAALPGACRLPQARGR